MKIIQKETLIRIIADILLVNLSFYLGIVTYLIATINGQPLTPRFPSPLSNSAQLTTIGFGVYLSASLVLSLATPLIFFLFGFYSYSRWYRGRYKLLIIITAVSVLYLVFGFIMNNFYPTSSLPPFVWASGYSFTLALVTLARLFAVLFENIFKTERKKMNAEGVKPIENVLIIGGGGYIGSVLTRKLLKRGYRVRVLDLFLYGEESLSGIQDKNLEIIRGDFRNVETVVSAMEDQDAVIHLGAIVGDPACALNPQVTFETNLLSSRFIAQTAKSFYLQRFIFASTCSVYGASKFPLNENSPTLPLSLYAMTKLLSEEVILKMGGNGFVPVILRFATVYGSSYRMRFDLVVNLLSAMATVDKKITILGGEQWRPFVHIEDVADACILALEAPKALVAGEIFNVGSSEENYRIREVGEIIKRIIPEAEIFEDNGNKDKRDYYVSFEKIKRKLGYNPPRRVIMGVEEIREKIKREEVINYKDGRYNNYLHLTNNGYIREVKWCDLLKVLDNG